MSTNETYHNQTAEQVLQSVYSTTQGLSHEEVKKRLQEHGLNVLPEPYRPHWTLVLLKQFQNFLIVILLAAALVSYLLHDVTDAYIILAAVLMNVIVGFIQEQKAEKALDALRQVITVHAKVLREGKEEIVEASHIVSGDMILLDTGDKIPADARLIEQTSLETNEAPLTGESTFVSKQLNPVDASSVVADRSNMVFTGTTVVSGSAKAVVVNTGSRTEIGHIAELLKTTQSDITPLQKKLDRFAHHIGIMVIGISAFVFFIGLIKQLPFVEIFTTSVAIAVSAIPEGLVVSVTIILAIGMQRILKRHALVRNLQAAETLGSTSVICTDKTGTLTEGNMQVVSLITNDNEFNNLHQSERHHMERIHELIFALNIGMLCNDAHIMQQGEHAQESTIVGNFTERALLAAGLNVGLQYERLLQDEPRIASIPFNSKAKFMATLHEHPVAKRRVYIKGAPEKIMQMATHIRRGEDIEEFTTEKREKFQQEFIRFSEQGLRMLGMAYKDLPAEQRTLSEADCVDTIFVGFVCIKDPLRPHIRETFEKTQRAGIHTVMITGDHKLTAKAIAQELGLPAEDHNIMEGEELHRLTQEQLNARVQDISVYARVSPEDKLNIIFAWKSKGKVVAMTGDGVNDSPALKASDIGVALGSGTDVAKEVADIVLLDDNYETIVAAVEEGRGIFENIRKVVLYLISGAFSEVILVIVALLLGIPVPLMAAQILWINLVTDGLPSIALTVDPKEKEIMNDAPRPLEEPVMNREMKILAAVVSVVTGLGSLLLFWYFWVSSDNIDLARSVAFTFLSISSLLYVFSVRSLRHSILHRSFFANPWLLAAIGGGFVIQLGALYIPFLQKVLHTVSLGLLEWSLILTTSIIVIAIIEIMKYLFIVFHKRKKFISSSASIS